MDDNEPEERVLPRPCGLAWLQIYLHWHRGHATEWPGSSAALHLLETGHRLGYGCCSDRVARLAQ